MVVKFHIVWTVLVCIAFAGIVIWAWSSKRKQDFDEAARLPLDDDDQPLTRERRETHNG